MNLVSQRDEHVWLRHFAFAKGDGGLRLSSPGSPSPEKFRSV
jgi:hypothetical protein